MGGHYILAYAQPPERADTHHQRAPERMLLWHANYHPDGGQLFFPLEHKPFMVPLALPGDDVSPEPFVCFRFDGSRGLYIHPNVWHEGVFGCSGTQRFFDKQGAVHARVSVDFARAFGCLLSVLIPSAQGAPPLAGSERERQLVGPTTGYPGPQGKTPRMGIS